MSLRHLFFIFDECDRSVVVSVKLAAHLLWCAPFFYNTRQFTYFLRWSINHHYNHLGDLLVIRFIDDQDKSVKQKEKNYDPLFHESRNHPKKISVFFSNSNYYGNDIEGTNIAVHTPSQFALMFLQYCNTIAGSWSLLVSSISGPTCLLGLRCN
jgi:hypothetical protein